MAQQIHVLIAGGGIGGLCLAQGLRLAGVSVAVYERDRSHDGWPQAFRIHIRPEAAEALRQSVPGPVWDDFVRCSGVPPTGLAFLDEQLRELARIGAHGSSLNAGEHRLGYPISRVTLRQVLLQGLEDVVHFGKTFLRYAQTRDGRVEGFFADGTSAVGDVLVGADGVHSKVREQLLPNASLVDVNEGRLDLLPALHSFEKSMLDYGFKAVKQSLRAAQYAASDNVLARSLFRMALRAVNALPPLKSRLLAA
jgi:2-polyprenyl-6-methoxyphenol hydroxylase-like FAD-dependent oxidoreductase